MEIGDKILWTSNIANPRELREGTVSKLGNGLCWVDGKHKPEECIGQDWTWPARAKEQLVEVLTERARLKKQFEDSLALVFQLRNKIKRGEL